MKEKQLLEKELKNEKGKYIQIQNKINAYKSNNKEEIVELYKKIDNLKEKLSRYPFELLQGEQIISVIFISDDQNIHYSVICKNTDKFIRLEEKLYNDYPEYSDMDCFFMSNGKVISKFKSLDENNIQNSDIIILYKKNN